MTPKQPSPTRRERLALTRLQNEERRQHIRQLTSFEIHHDYGFETDRERVARILNARKASVIPIALILIVLLCSTSLEAATYFVSKAGNDRNFCTTAQDDTPGKQKLTIQAGLACLTQPGDTLTIHEGLYVESIHEYMFPVSGTAGAVVTVQGAPGETVILRPSGGTGNVIGLYTDPLRHYMTFRDLELDGINAGGGGGGAVFFCGQPDNITLERVHIHNGDGNGILCAGRNHVLRDLEVHHNGLSTAYLISNGFYGVGNNVTIVGGRYYDNECYGIRFWDSSGSHTADDNTIDGAEVYGNGVGIGLGGASRCTSDGGGVTLADNRNTLMNSLVHDNAWGVQLFDFRAGRGLVVNNNTIRGNTFFGLYIPANQTGVVYRSNRIYRNGSGQILDNGVGSLFSGNVTSPDDPFILVPTGLMVSQ